ncbi:MAG: TIGR03557 family F420-dependent LLM class oxidoreductase [Nitrososphaerota archaeon]
MSDINLRIGFVASMEQYQPSFLLSLVTEIEKAGFDSIWASDHFHPWFHTNAAGGFAWVWIAAAVERSKKLSFGTAVTCPTLRYNPAIIAQAFATLGSMYPRRIFLGLGTGEAMNEMPVGCPWPSFKTRVKMLEEAVMVIKKLWNESFIDFKGKYYTLRRANLYTRPAAPIPIYIAASGSTVAELAGRLADGFLTIPLEESHYREVIFPALERGVKSVGRSLKDIDMAVEVYVSYDEDYDSALRSVRCWAATLLPFMFKYPIYDPREIELYGKLVGDEHLKKVWMIGTTPEDHIKHIEHYIKLGFRNIHVTSSSPDEKKTISMYGGQVIPYLKSTYK